MDSTPSLATSMCWCAPGPLSPPVCALRAACTSVIGPGHGAGGSFSFSLFQKGVELQPCARALQDRLNSLGTVVAHTWVRPA